MRPPAGPRGLLLVVALACGLGWASSAVGQDSAKDTPTVTPAAAPASTAAEADSSKATATSALKAATEPATKAVTKGPKPTESSKAPDVTRSGTNQEEGTGTITSATPSGGDVTGNEAAGDVPDASEAAPVNQESTLPAQDSGVPNLIPWFAFAIAAATLLLTLGLGVPAWSETRRVRETLAHRDDPRRSLSDNVSLLVRHITAMTERLERLEREIEVLRNAGPPPPAPPATRTRAFYEEAEPQVGDGAYFASRPVPTPMPPPPLPPSLPASDGAAIRELTHHPEVRHLLSQYGQVAGGDRDARAAFEQEFEPVVIAIAADGENFYASGDGDLWFVPLMEADQFGLILPGPNVVRNWAKLFRTMGGQAAKEKFGVLFRYEDGENLSVDAPAWGKRVDERNFRRLEGGVLRGVVF